MRAGYNFNSPMNIYPKISASSLDEIGVTGDQSIVLDTIK